MLNRIPRGVGTSKESFSVVWDDQEGSLTHFDVMARLFKRRIVYTDGLEDGDGDGWSPAMP